MTVLALPGRWKNDATHPTPADPEKRIAWTREAEWGHGSKRHWRRSIEGEIFGSLRRSIPPPCCSCGPGTYIFGFLGGFFGALEASRGPPEVSWGPLAVPWGASWGRLGRLLAAWAAILGGSPGALWKFPFGAPLGALLGCLEALLGSLGALLKPSDSVLSRFPHVCSSVGSTTLCQAFGRSFQWTLNHSRYVCLT